MKKQIGLFIAILFAVSTLMMACKPEVHTHTFAEEWSSDETDHWKAATCEHKDEVIDKAKHTFGDWTITKAATCTDEGSKIGVCKVCKNEVTKKLMQKGTVMANMFQTMMPQQKQMAQKQEHVKFVEIKKLL